MRTPPTQAACACAPGQLEYFSPATLPAGCSSPLQPGPFLQALLFTLTQILSTLRRAPIQAGSGPPSPPPAATGPRATPHSWQLTPLKSSFGSLLHPMPHNGPQCLAHQVPVPQPGFWAPPLSGPFLLHRHPLTPPAASAHVSSLPTTHAMLVATSIPTPHCSHQSPSQGHQGETSLPGPLVPPARADWPKYLPWTFPSSPQSQSCVPRPYTLFQPSLLPPSSLSSASILNWT